jgi:hypothetical protein
MEFGVAFHVVGAFEIWADPINYCFYGLGEGSCQLSNAYHSCPTPIPFITDDINLLH